MVLLTSYVLRTVAGPSPRCSILKELGLSRQGTTVIRFLDRDSVYLKEWYMVVLLVNTVCYVLNCQSPNHRVLPSRRPGFSIDRGLLRVPTGKASTNEYSVRSATLLHMYLLDFLDCLAILRTEYSVRSME